MVQDGVLLISRGQFDRRSNEVAPLNDRFFDAQQFTQHCTLVANVAESSRYPDAFISISRCQVSQ